MRDILLQLLPHIVSSLLYAALGFHFWRTRWKETGQPLVTLPMQPWERAGILGALIIQGWGLAEGLFGAGGMRFSFSYALSLMLWLAVLIYWIESFRSRMDGLQPMVLPLAALAAAAPAAFPQLRVVANADSWGFLLHFLTAMLAYSLFTLSALHAVFMGFAERKLHRRAITRGLSSLPPILTMEALLFRMISVAFVLLTVALLSGVFFSEALFGRALAVDHKTLFAFASWGIFAALLIGRRVYGWRGRVALRWTLAGFMVLFLAYIGSRFVAEVVLGRI
ncbi:inner membrane protein YpjD [Accumulibacter sp.]|uniref:cytochrome C assembly family protein n=1 Tax=Accumulibacter sp. TaxID=2053492 RepID=UPI002600A290|nr:cytochrome c biogenesis protein CcsA [Accumulibacter sp.]MCM8596009.1 cytochrome c biogenesis protein CcsA [Accumulibacter sp.]MCM8626653.1 cytochrome c biogenesis protein CcsA [Accumulibacter sp.]MDS4050158.1 cytochrome c biogenesis protein CcsA [Accumulibacter sp.]